MIKEKEIEKINHCISDLVYDKIALKKAYNYYHGIRDAEQFRHIEENYGIGVPTSVGFTPLIKKHIDVLVGEYLELDPDLQITCKDEETLSNIMRDKKLKIDKELYEFLRKYLQNAIVNILLNSQQPVNDPFIEKEMQKIQNDIEQSYISDYEIAAQNILSYIRNSRDLDLKNKMRELFTDILVAGICYYRVRPKGDNISLEILNPLDTFIERNQNEFYLNKSRRAVVRRWLTKEQILDEFGDDLGPEAIDRLDGMFERYSYDDRAVVVRSTGALYDDNADILGNGKTPSPGILGGLEIHPLFPWDESGRYTYSNADVIEVYECEWLEWSKKKNRSVLHYGVRIGNDIFITPGESKYYVQNRSNPKDVSLNINGMFFNDKNGQPYSLMLATMNLQDKYDLLLYCRDNLIATSGTVGDWIDIAHIPVALGVTMPERIMKWQAYKKNGLALYDSSQEGAQILNTTFNGFDDTVKAQSIQAIQIAIESVEAQASATTGVFAEKLGGIQERDAVSNVKVGIHQSSLLTKQYFHAMDLMYKEVNYDLLNLAKVVYKNGITGSIILGDRLVKTFTALPEHYTLTDFDIHIQDSSEAYKMREDIKAINIELIKAGMVDVQDTLSIITAKNMTQLKKYVEQSIKNKKAENDMIGQLQQQVEQMTNEKKQYEQQMQQLNSEIQRLQSQVENNNREKLQIEKQKVAIDEQVAKDKKDYNDKLIEVKEKQLTAEILQIRDGNPYNDQIRDV